MLFEIGVKLAQVLWRKLNPKDISQADIQLNDCTQSLIKSGEYRLAITLLDFSCEILKKHVDEKTERLLIVNRANAYKLSGDKDKADKIMASLDWTATSDFFQLASAAIKDDVDVASQLVVKIGKSDPDLNARAYREWPLFEPLRHTAEFKAAFQKVFGQPLTPTQLVVEGQIEHTHEDDVHESTESSDSPSDPQKKKKKSKVVIN